MSAYERVSVDAAPEATVSALREALRSRGITEYAVVDHGHDMAAAGAPGFTAWTLVFGSPAAEAKLLARDLDAAVDIPLRLAVVAPQRAHHGSPKTRQTTDDEHRERQEGQLEVDLLGRDRTQQVDVEATGEAGQR